MVRERGSRAWLGCFLSLGLLAIAVKCGWLAAIDSGISQWTQTIRSTSMDSIVRMVTFFGSSLWIAAVIALMVWFWVAKRRWNDLWLFMGGGLLGIVGVACIRLLVGHWRPDVQDAPAAMDPITRFQLAGFPSGHAFRSAFLYGWWAFVLSCNKKFWIRACAIVCAILILIVGASRIYLHRHWFTDVIGGWLVAITVLSLIRKSAVNSALSTTQKKP